MKQFKSSLLYIGCLSLLLQGCSHDDSLTDGTDAPAPGTALTILAHDAGYTAADGTPTRATEDGYITKFANGDKIGVFAVGKNGAVIPDCQNVPCTYNGTNWTGNVYYYTDAEYFAYYPYDENLSADITSPEGIVTAFQTKLSATTDQSDYDKYTALDLMTTPATSPSNKSLTFSFKHQMALVVISLPKVKYTFTNTNPTIPDYIIPMPDTKFTGFTPCPMPDGTYRYLVAPSANNDLSGSYTTLDKKTIEYTCTNVSNIAASNYKNYVVDRATVIEKSHTLAVGDFYMNDGTLLAGTTTSLSAEQQAACIGVVYSIDANRIGEAAKEALEEKGVIAPHGLVMALTNASEGCRWGIFKKDENSDGEDGAPFKDNTDQLLKQYANVDGYGETQWMVDKIDNGGYSADTYAAFDVARKYGTAAGSTEKYAVPANTTGWFIPGMGQWWNILSNLGGIDLSGYQSNTKLEASISGVASTVTNNMNTYLNKIGNATTFSTGTYFWSSSEYRSDGACDVIFLSNGTLYLSPNPKDRGNRAVRCSFAF